MAVDFSKITLAVLAGGEGSRMGRPKNMLQIQSMPILQYLMENWRWPGPTMLVTAPGREHPPAAERFDVEAIDPVADEGPLRGVHTALHYSTTDLVVFTTVDMPNVSILQLTHLSEMMLQTPDAMGLMFSRLIGTELQIEPFPSAFRKSAIGLVETRLNRQERSVYRLKNENNVLVRPAPEHWPADCWINVNSPADLLKWMNT